MITETLRGFLGNHPHATLVTVFSILYACGLGVPIPEEITLLVSGWAAYKGYVNLYVVMVVCVVAILAGDFTMFSIARKWGDGLLQTRFGRWLLPAPRVDKVRKFFDRHGTKTVFFARFLAGIRMPVYFIAGTVKMSPVRFILLDLAGALISGPTSIYIAWRFSRNFENAMAHVKHANHILLVVIVSAVILTIAWHWWGEHRDRMEARRKEKEKEIEPPAGA